VQDFLFKSARALSRLVAFLGKIGAWASVVMILVILTDVVLRRYFVIGSAKLQELEWHLHGILFLTTLGYGYLEGAHVRIELFREKWSPKTKAWVELLGILLFLLPFTLVAIHFSIDYAEMAYRNSEISASLTGLGFRWVIKSVLAFGLGLLLLAGVAEMIYLLLYLFGPKRLQKDLDFHATTFDTPHVEESA